MAKAATKSKVIPAAKVAAKPTVKPVAKGLAAIAKKANAAKPAAPDTTEVRVDTQAMTAPVLAKFVKENGLATPDDWAKKSLVEKKAWLEATYGDGGKGKKDGKAPRPPKEAPPPKKELVKIPVAKAVKILEGDIIAGTDFLTDVVNAVENLDEAKVKEMISGLAQEGGISQFKLGGLLSRVTENSWYAPHESFAKYCDVEHNIAYRTAAEAVKVYNDLARLGEPYERFGGLAWSKIRLISSIVKRETLSTWVKTAKKMTVRDLAESVKAHKNADKKALGPSDAKAVKSLIFKIHDDQEVTISEAIAKAKSLGSTDTAAVALEYICLDFIGASKQSLVAQLRQVGLQKALDSITEAYPEVQMEAKVQEEATAQAA